MSRLKNRVNALLEQARRLRAEKAVIEDPRHAEAVRIDLLARLARIRASMTDEEVAAHRAMLPASAEERLASLRADLAGMAAR